MIMLVAILGNLTSFRDLSSICDPSFFADFEFVISSPARKLSVEWSQGSSPASTPYMASR